MELVGEPENGALKRFPADWIVPAGVIAFYVWTSASTGSPFQFRGANSGYYGLLTDGFLAGHLYLTVMPAPELLALADPYDPVTNSRYRVHDMSLYRGKYYMYFGAVPALTLFLPWRLATGRSPPEDLAALVYITGGYVFSLLLLRLLVRANVVRTPLVAGAAAALILGFGQYGAVVLRSPGVYGVAIASGYCYFAAALYCFARLVLGGKQSRALAVVAGVLVGLASGCRPHYALAALILSTAYVCYLKGPRLELVLFVVPIVLCGALSLWYNFARFGNVFEFGTSYQLTNNAYTRGVTFNLRSLPADLYYMLACPARLWDQFPFVIPRFVAQHSGLYVENAVGLLVLSPVAAAGLALPSWIRRFEVGRACRFILAAVYGAAAAVLILSVSPASLSAATYWISHRPCC